MKNRTLTTIGLPIRLEVLIKSHLKLVNARTIDRWSFSDDSNADVAICAPDSPLSAVTVKRARESGLPLCISLIDSRHQPLPGTGVLHDPLRVTDIIELLDRVSGGLKPSMADDESAIACKPEVGVEDYRARFVHTLHELMNAGSRDLHLVEVGSVRFCMLPVSRSLFLQEPPNESWLDQILDVDQEVTASVIPIAQQQQGLLRFQHRASLIKVLWHAGLNGAHAEQISALPANSAISLSRWPDFGNLKHKPVHLRMAAELSRKRMTLAQLANLAHVPIEQVDAFVHACALCNLISTQAHSAQASISIPTPAPVTLPIDAGMITPRRNLGFLHSIRMALGLRAA